MFTITNVCSSSNISFHKEFKCVICGCQPKPTAPPKVISENLNLSNCFCNLYDINSTVCRLDIESIFQNSRLCSKCHEEITHVEALNSQIEILKRQIQSIKLSYDSKLREFKVNSAAVGTVEDEAKENHEKLFNYAFHCNIPATFIIPNLESEVPVSFSGSGPNYLQLPDQDVKSLTFDFEEASGLDCGELDTDNDLADIKSEVVSDNDEDSKPVVVSSKSGEISNSLNLAALRSKYKLKNLSVRVKRVQLEKKVKRIRKRIRPKTNETPKVKRQKMKLAREARLKSFTFVCSHPGCSRRFSDEIEKDGHTKSAHEGILHPFECLICNRNFKFYRKLKEHGNVHTGLLTFKCQHPGCDKEYPTNDQVQDHRRRMHRPQDIVCEYCGKAFRRPLAYKEHVRSSHTKESPFQCEICGKSYPIQSTLNKHRLTHPELKDSDTIKKCKYCGKIFTWKYYLLLHERQHTGEFSFKCHICNFTSNVESGFTCHMARHNRPARATLTPKKTVTSKTTRPESAKFLIECDFCQRKFTKNKGLRQHKQLYHFDTSGGFTCAECGKAFGSNHQLGRHEEIHKLIKKFPCTLCGKTFAQNGTLKYHMSHIHKIDTKQDKSK